MINTNYRYAIENVGLSTSPTTITTATNADGSVEVTVSNFRYDFPPFSLVNITLGNIVNGPVAGVITPPYSIRTYATRTATTPVETTAGVAGTLLAARPVAAEIVHDSSAAHAKGGCLLVVDIASDITANSSLELTFSASFAGAHTLSSVDIASASHLTATSFAGTVPFTLILTPNPRMSSHLKAVVVLKEAIPRGSTLALKFSGQLRNPRRPGAGGFNSFAIIDPFGNSQLVNTSIPQTVFTAGELEQVPKP